MNSGLYNSQDSTMSSRSTTFAEFNGD